MNDIAAITSTLSASFLGSFVEVVEAFTIILAVGLSRGWRPAAGTMLALLSLAGMVIVLGPLLSLVPLDLLRFAVGVLLILFGMRWLRKAILRASGFIALHDKEKAFAEETDILKQQAQDRRADFLAGLAAYKAVLLEGVEVVFIVIAVGAGHGLTGYASVGAVAAVLLVLAIGVVVHRPLSQVPEHALKFVVGLMLSSFGVFWTGEGLGAAWPGADAALLGIAALFTATALMATKVLRSYLAAQPVTAPR